AVRRRLFDRVEDAPDLVLHEIPEAFAVTRARADGVDDPLGRRKPDVGGDQQLFERLDRVDVDRASALLLGVGLLDDLFEAADDLLLGPREAVTKFVKKSQIPNPKSQIPRTTNPTTNHQ